MNPVVYLSNTKPVLTSVTMATSCQQFVFLVMAVTMAISIPLNILMIANGGLDSLRIESLLGSFNTLGNLSRRSRKLQTPNAPPYDVYKAIAESPLHRRSFFIPPKDRQELGTLLEAMGGFRTGVELGVQAGGFAETTLKAWKSCTKYYLVDIWAHQEHYEDVRCVILRFPVPTS